MGTMAMAAFVQLLTIIANRTAMLKMRAEMATTDDAKKAAIDEGLKVSDMFQGLLQRIQKHIAELKDDDPAATIAVKPPVVVAVPVK